MSHNQAAHLQQQGALADARVAANEDHGARHDPAAQHARHLRAIGPRKWQPPLGAVAALPHLRDALRPCASSRATLSCHCPADTACKAVARGSQSSVQNARLGQDSTLF